MFQTLKNWHRRRLIQRSPLPKREWQKIIRLPLFQGLTNQELIRLSEWVILFLQNKQISGAKEFEITPTIQLTIAAQACLPILYLDPDYYGNWVSIVVYPDIFLPPHQFTDLAGVVHESRLPTHGLALEGGPVVLSWADIETKQALDGFNVIIHEFAHKLDMLNGSANGHPPLHPGMSNQTWAAVFNAAYLDFCQQVAFGLAQFNPYAAESPAEFFAVMSEYFFERPADIHAVYPKVYEQLAQFYQQDPLSRLAPVALTKLDCKRYNGQTLALL